MNLTTSLPLERVPGERVPAMVWKLLLLRLRIMYNSFRHAKLSHKIGSIALTLVILGFAAFLLFLSWLLLDFLRAPDLSDYIGLDPRPVLAAIPPLILTGLFFSVLLTSFGVLLQALYLSGDMDFLLAAPVPIRAVFITKLLQAVLPNFAMLSLFGLPVLFGLGASSGYNFLYYPLVLVVMVVLALAAAGISSLLVMLVVRVLPPRRAAEILGFLGATIGFACSQIGNLTNSFGRDVNLSGQQVTGTLTQLSTPWMPLNWAGQGLVALGEGRWLAGILLVGVTLGLSAVTFGFALATAERWYYTGWAGMQVVERKKKPVQAPRTALAEGTGLASGLIRLLPPPVWSILHKDFLTLRRDLRNLSQLVSPLILGVIYTLAIFRSGGEPPPGQGEAPAWFMTSLRLVMSYSSVGMSLFVGWMLLSRLAGMGFSQEGKNYWVLKASPVRSGHLLAAKFLVAYLPALGLGLVFLAVIAARQGLSAVEFLYSLTAIVLCLAGMTGILLAFGVAGANFNWDDPRKMTAGGMGCLGQFLTMLFLPVSFGLFVVPLGVVEFLQLPLGYGYLIGLLGGFGVTAGCTVFPLWLVRKKVERLGEE
ncbi:MAG: putative ABC transporter permease subunit [Chloroflexota bacterium]